jgi:hypothetical protein
LEHDSNHPYWYGRVIRIFHVMVRYMGGDRSLQQWKRMNVLWVRWYGICDSCPAGFKARRLYQVGFPQGTDEEAFGFLDPSNVLRAIHLVPNFTLGKTANLLPPDSIGRRKSDKNEDYFRYYVNMCVPVFLSYYYY